MGRALGRILVREVSRRILERLVPMLRVVALTEAPRADAIDDDDLRRLTDLIEEQSEAHARATEGEVSRTARAHLRQSNETHRDDTERQLAAAVRRRIGRRVSASEARVELGLNPTAAEPWLAKALEDRVAATVAMMDWVGQGVYRQVARDLTADLIAGVRVEEIARRLERDYSRQAAGPLGLGRRRARFVARNELGNLTSELSQRRQNDLGVTHYIWRTSGDERVRGRGGKYPHAEVSHRAREGQRFAWADKPDEGRNDGHPGTPYNCRCTAEPDLDEVPMSSEPQRRRRRRARAARSG